MSSLVPILIVALLIALNGLFVAAEFAIVGVSRAEIEANASKGSGAARLLRSILADPRRQDRFIATAQLGITLASLGLGMYGEHVLAEWIAHHLEAWGASRWIAAHTVASVVAIAILTYFHIVLGEMVPKSLALQHARRTALWVAPLMRAIELGAYPLVIALNGIGNGLLRLAGIDRSTASTDQYRSAEEIAYIVRESQAGGLLRKESAEVINELLEFGDLTAGELMVPRVRVAGLPLGADSDHLRAVLHATPHTRYPVYDGTLDNIVGTLHVRDVLRLAAKDTTLAREHVRPVPFVPETVRTEQVLAAMRQSRTQLAVVMDEHGGTGGILTLEDLFEEVVGDITDRSDEVPEVLEEAPDRLRADGAARVEDVGAALGVVLEHEAVDTVSGLVLALLGRPPRPGDTVTYDGVKFEVLAVRGHGVASCRVTRSDDARGGRA